MLAEQLNSAEGYGLQVHWVVCGRWHPWKQGHGEFMIGCSHGKCVGKLSIGWESRVKESIGDLGVGQVFNWVCDAL